MEQELRELQVGDFVKFVDVARAMLGNSEPIVLSESGKWYCATVKAGRHKRVELELARLGYRSFYPRTKRWISHARVKTAQERPILNRYVFIEVDHPRQSFGEVLNIHDIDSVISGTTAHGRNDPVAFPSAWVEGLIGRYLAGEWDFVTPGLFPFKDENEKLKFRENAVPPIGANIRILEGEFADMCAKVTGRKGRTLEFRLAEKTMDGKVEGRAAAMFVRAA